MKRKWAEYMRYVKDFYAWWDTLSEEQKQQGETRSGRKVRAESGGGMKCSSGEKS
jgi:hypothetical protein